jgi:hypothetical protein
MKFLCIPCDTPMKLQTVGPPDRGSLSVVYACPECGYEIAMLTNAYETQVVQSLGVRIGPSEAPATAGESRAEASANAGCPFAGMIPTDSPGARAGTAASGDVTADAGPIRWTAAAEARLEKVPSFVRPMARSGIERFARERGALEVDEKILDAAREFFGM